MSKGIFTDRTHQPTRQEIQAALGSKRPAWEELTRFVSEKYGGEGELKFYGKNYGWAVRFRRSGKALLSLYPGKNWVTAQIILGRPQVEKARVLKLGKNVRQTLESAHQYPEGRWLFIKVGSKKDISDIEALLLLKSRPPERRES